MELTYRKSPRIPGYDYAKPNYYFITICTHKKKCIFGSVNQLNAYGIVARDCLTKIPDYYQFVRIDKYVVMPNHVHAIMIIEQDDQCEKNADIAQILGQYKMAVTKIIRQTEPEIQVWQRSFHDHIIRNQKGYEKIWLYIEDNPRKWEEDCFFINSEE